MTQPNASTMPARSGDSGAPREGRVTRVGRERAAQNARRRWLILFAAVVLVVAAILANIAPLTHFQDASGRLDKVAGKVGMLEEQKAQLQSQLARLSETGYLETLARQQLTYVRPGEDLYIVTGTSGGVAGGSGGAGTMATLTAQGLGAGLAGVPASGAGSAPAAAPGGAGQGTGQGAGQSAGQSSGQAALERPGFFERVISAIRGLF
jgi:cell division protein FtsB